LTPIEIPKRSNTPSEGNIESEVEEGVTHVNGVYNSAQARQMANTYQNLNFLPQTTEKDQVQDVYAQSKQFNPVVNFELCRTNSSYTITQSQIKSTVS